MVPFSSVLLGTTVSPAHYTGAGLATHGVSSGPSSFLPRAFAVTDPFACNAYCLMKGITASERSSLVSLRKTLPSLVCSLFYHFAHSFLHVINREFLLFAKPYYLKHSNYFICLPIYLRSFSGVEIVFPFIPKLMELKIVANKAPLNK